VQQSVSGGAVATGEARADQDQLKLNGIALEQHYAASRSFERGRSGARKTRLAGSDIVIFMGQCG